MSRLRPTLLSVHPHNHYHLMYWCVFTPWFPMFFMHSSWLFSSMSRNRRLF